MVIFDIPFSNNLCCTVSDTCASGKKKDESGPVLRALISSGASENLFEGDTCYTAIVQDDEALITVTINK